MLTDLLNLSYLSSNAVVITIVWAWAIDKSLLAIDKNLLATDKSLLATGKSLLAIDEVYSSVGSVC
jgi:hypothetical protein